MESPNPSSGGELKKSPGRGGKRESSPGRDGSSPGRDGKRKRSLGPTEVIPEAPPQRGEDELLWRHHVRRWLHKHKIEVKPDLYRSIDDYEGCDARTLEEYVEAVHRAESDEARKACKSILHGESLKAIPKYSPELSSGNKSRDLFLKAFSEKYNDDHSCLETFTYFVDTCAAEWSSASYLAPYTSLVQSSGTGKSRLVKEFANERYVIYCCVRERDSSGVPARSFIADALVPASCPGDQLERLKGFLLYAAFFCACMDRLTDWIEGPAKRTEREWCEMQLKEDNRQTGVEFWKEIQSRMTRFQANYHLEDHSDDAEKFTKLLESKIQLSCKKLRESFRAARLPTNRALLTFALDESRSLLGEYGATTHFSIFRWMASSLAEKCGIFIVLLDTTSKISNFMPSKIPDASFRYSDKSEELLPAFYAVDTFDILAPKEKLWTVSGDPPSDLTSLLFKHFMKGRPLFGSYLQSGSDDEQVVKLANVVRLAAAKLLGGISLDQETKDIKDPYVAVALLSVRAAVSVKPQSELASSLVAKHLGMCLAISSDRHLVFTGYPSEPVLAEAACRIMNQSELDVGEILDPMLTYVREGIVEGGARGELVARILFLLAWDHACNNTSKCEPQFTILSHQNVLYTRPLVVREFLHSLADKDQFDAALEGQIDSKEMERFMSGRVFFTHFTSVTRSVEQSELEDFYERGVAILCKRNQAAVDMIIPVRLCQDVSYIMSYILVQVRNYTHSDGNFKWASLQVRPENAGLSGKPADYPYLALYLQLGYQSGKVYNLKYEKHDVANHTAKPLAIRREASGSESVEDRFQMIIGLFSLKPAAYPCLRDEGKQTYGPTQESKNSKRLSDLCRAWTDPLYHIESKERTALGGRKMQQAKSNFVERTCVLTYASSSSGGAAAPVAKDHDEDVGSQGSR